MATAGFDVVGGRDLLNGAAVWQLAGNKPVQHAADGVDVGADREAARLAAELLG